MQLRSDVLSALAVTAALGLAIQADLSHSAEAVVQPEAVHEPVSFATEVMPILEQHCWECHSDQSAELGLKLDTYEGVMAGSDYGTVVEAGDGDGSLMIDMMLGGDMPENGDPVPADQIEMIKTWIDEGAENN
ncbi:MAG: c-type cytochrome domain-containing protein [Gemmatimonadota bacterium]